MGRLGVTPAHLLLAAGSLLVIVGVWLLTCSPGWTCVATGIVLVLFALTLVNVPSPATDSSGPTRIGR